MHFKTLAAIILLALASAGEVAAQSTQRVQVVNFPDIQEIRGEVNVKGALRLSAMSSFTGVMVPPVEPTETTRLVPAGILKTDGYSNVVLSLYGQVKGSVTREGSVGALLIPKEQRIEEAFNELGQVHFSLKVDAQGITAETAYFASGQPRYTIGFQSYSVLLYNTTDKAVTVDLYAYLTN
jgi:hypothetical protein